MRRCIWGFSSRYSLRSRRNGLASRGYRPLHEQNNVALHHPGDIVQFMLDVLHWTEFAHPAAAKQSTLGYTRFHWACKVGQPHSKGAVLSMGYDVHITRAENWADNEGHEIQPSEWH